MHEQHVANRLFNFHQYDLNYYNRLMVPHTCFTVQSLVLKFIYCTIMVNLKF